MVHILIQKMCCRYGKFKCLKCLRHDKWANIVTGKEVSIVFKTFFFYFSNIIILFLHAAESQNMTGQKSTYLPKHFHINPETRMNTGICLITENV